MEMCLEFLWLSDKKINFSSTKKEFPGLMKKFNDKCVLWKTVKRKFHLAIFMMLFIQLKWNTVFLSLFCLPLSNSTYMDFKRFQQEAVEKQVQEMLGHFVTYSVSEH